MPFFNNSSSAPLSAAASLDTSNHRKEVSRTLSSDEKILRMVNSMTKEQRRNLGDHLSSSQHSRRSRHHGDQLSASQHSRRSRPKSSGTRRMRTKSDCSSASRASSVHSPVGVPTSICLDSSVSVASSTAS